MKVIRNITLYLLFLIAMVVCATAVMKIYDMILDLDIANIWTTGFKVGFTAWGAMLLYMLYYRHKKQ